MPRSEDVLGEKVDRCFADSLLKISGGIAIGVVASVAFFKVSCGNLSILELLLHDSMFTNI